MLNYDAQVILLNIFLFVFTFLAGYLPMIIKTSKNWMNLIAICGAGMLMGAALIVIIPEGIMTLVKSQLQLETHNLNSGEPHDH
jgi:zinc transporter 9